MGYIPDVASGSAPYLTDSLAKKILGGTQAPINPHSQRLLAASLKPTKPQMTGARGKPKVKGKPKAKSKGKAKASAKASTKKNKKKTTTETDNTWSQTEISQYYSSTKRQFMEKSGPQIKSSSIVFMIHVFATFCRECDCLYVASCFTLTCSLNWYEPGLNSKMREARQVNYLHVFARADTPHIQFMT